MATWYDSKGFIPVVKKLAPLSPPGAYDRNKTYIVTTIEEPPYIIRNTDSSEIRSNGLFRGFCEELTKMITEKLELKCELQFKFQFVYQKSVLSSLISHHYAYQY